MQSAPSLLYKLLREFVQMLPAPLSEGEVAQEPSRINLGYLGGGRRPQLPAGDIWAEVLDTERDSDDFALRYAEVVFLAAQTQLVTAELPIANQPRYTRATADWWRLVLGPNNSLSGIPFANEPRDGFAVDQLGALGDLADQRLLQGANAQALTPAGLEWLVEQCEVWYEVVMSTGSLHAEVRDVIGAQIRHLAWLASAHETFGPGPTYRQAANAAAWMHDANRQVRDPEQRSRWKEVAAAVTVLCVTLSGFVTTAVVPVLEAGAETLQQVERVRGELLQLGHADSSSEQDHNESDNDDDMPLTGSSSFGSCATDVQVGPDERGQGPPYR